MIHTQPSHRSRSLAALLILSVLAAMPFAPSSATAQKGGVQSTPEPLTNGKGTRTDGGNVPFACVPPFSDVHTTDFYYDSVRFLYCSGAIGGYSDNTYRPGN
ncbi:MAG: S-layer homology domain-containing protein, partial [Chloroflexia bacterium]